MRCPDPEMAELLKAVRNALHREIVFQVNQGPRTELNLDRLAATAVRELIDFLDKPQAVH